MQNKRNEALESHAIFFDPAYMQMRLHKGPEGIGPRHFDEEPGVKVEENGDVTFCFYAPEAKTMEVAGFGNSAMTGEHRPMAKDEKGYFRVTVSGIPAGFHYHEYFMDGVNVVNPQAPVGYGAHKAVNFFEKEGDEDFYLLKDVPHGEVRMEYFHSSVTGRTRVCYVYTPPGYGKDETKKYPVLYLQHGGGESESGWIWQGKANLIADNLIAAGECPELLIVMNCLYCQGPEPEEFMAGDFDSMLLKDCMPYIEKKYAVDPEKRGMAGLSMGSYQTVMTTLNHLGMFPYIGIFSGTPERRWYAKEDYMKAFEDPEVFKERVEVLFFGYGEQEERIVTGLGKQFEEFKEKGIPYTVYTCPGYHEWTVWRRCLREFLKLLH